MGVFGDFWANLNNDGSGRKPTHYNDPNATATARGWSGAGGRAAPTRGQGVGTGTFAPTDKSAAPASGKLGAYTNGVNANPAQGAWSNYLKGGMDLDARKAATGPGAGTPPAGGTQSGPGILQNWFNQRATGTDPGWLYSTGRAEDQINNRYARSGGYNSSGANQSISDMYANAVSQREGQLDNLAGGASGEHAGQLDQMFKYGLGIAGGQASTGADYDKTTVSSQQQAQVSQIQLMLSKGEIDAKTAQAMITNLLSMGNMAASAAGANKGKTA